MGSGVKRKPADRLRINHPMEDGAGGRPGNGSGASAGGAAPQDINNVCPVTIRSKLASQDIAVGTELVLDGKSLRLATNPAIEVGTVSASILKTLQTCLGMGINYPAIHVVVDKQGVCHAEFAQ